MRNYILCAILLLTMTLDADAQVPSRLIGCEDSTTDIYGVLNVRNAFWNTFSGNRGTTFYNSSGQGPFNIYYYNITSYSLSDTTFESFNDYIAPPVQDSSMYVRFYDSKNNCSLLYIYGWNTNTVAWDIYEKDSFNYNSTNNLVSKYVYHYNGTTVILDSVNNFTYSNNLLVLAVTQSPAGTNSMKRDYTYTGNNLSSQKLSIWVTNAWVDSEKVDYTYTNNLLVLQDRFTWDNSLPGWALVQENTYSYTITGQPLTATQSGWTKGFLNYSNKDSNVYAGNQLICQYYASASTFGSPTLTYTTRDSLGYDGHNNIILLYRHRINSSGSLVNDEKVVTTFDNQNQPLVQKRYYWKGSTWINGGAHCSVKYYYQQNTSVADITKDIVGITLYPMPANNLMNCKINTKEPGAVTFIITDMHGKLMRQWTSSLKLNMLEQFIPLSEFPAGNYILQCNKSGVVSAKEFTIVR